MQRKSFEDTNQESERESKRTKVSAENFVDLSFQSPENFESPPATPDTIIKAIINSSSEPQQNLPTQSTLQTPPVQNQEIPIISESEILRTKIVSFGIKKVNVEMIYTLDNDRFFTILFKSENLSELLVRLTEKITHFNLTADQYAPITVHFSNRTKLGHGALFIKPITFKITELKFITDLFEAFIYQCLQEDVTMTSTLDFLFKNFLEKITYQRRIEDSILREFLPDAPEHLIIGQDLGGINLKYLSQSNTASVLMGFAPIIEEKQLITDKVIAIRKLINARIKMNVLKQVEEINFKARDVKDDHVKNLIGKISIYHVELNADKFKLIIADLYAFLKLLVDGTKTNSSLKIELGPAFQKFYDQIKINSASNLMSTNPARFFSIPLTTKINNAPTSEKIETVLFQYKNILVNYEADKNNQLLIRFVVSKNQDRKKLINYIKKLDLYDLSYQEESNTGSVSVSVVVPIQISDIELANEKLMTHIHKLRDLILNTNLRKKKSGDEIIDAVNQLITVLFELKIIKDLQGSNEKPAGLQLSNESFVLK